MKEKKKQTKQYSVKQMRLAGEHIKKYRKEKNVSRDIFAMKVKDAYPEAHISTATLYRWESGQKQVPDKMAEILHKMTGIIKEYWLGKTECQTDEDYHKECVESGIYFDDEYYDPVQVAAMARISQIESMLNLCGIGYTNFKEPTAENDFYEIICDADEISEIETAKENKTFHRISLPSFTDPVYLSEREMSALIRDISDFISYSCYKKINRSK